MSKKNLTIILEKVETFNMIKWKVQEQLRKEKEGYLTRQRESKGCA